jgi:Zn-dependent protease with chaperone function
MGSLGHVVLALAALAAAESGLERELLPPWLVLALVPLPLVLARLAERAFIRARFRLGELLHRALSFSPPLLFLLALAAFGWRTAVERATGGPALLFAWPDLRVLVVLAPWILFELLALHARAVTFVAATERGAWLGFNLRMLAAGLVPVAVYVAAATLVGTSEELRVTVEEVGLYHVLFAAALIAVLALALPFFLERVWDTAPLPEGASRSAVLAVAREAGFESPRLRVWRTGQQMSNAAIVGLTKRSRMVLFSDLLLAQLPPRELAAVFAHELGHAARAHVPLFLTWILAAFLAGDLLARTWFEDEPALAGALLLAVLGAWFAGFTWLSRRCELEADLHALELLGESLTLISALERVGGRLRDVAGWRHFSIADRVRFLERAQADPAVAHRLRATLRRAAVAGAVVLVLAAIPQAARLAADLPQDRLRADLRLGNYAAAVQRAGEARELDPLLALLVSRAGTLATDGVTVERLELELAAAERRGDAQAAEEWRALLTLRADRLAASEQRPERRTDQ